MAEATTAPLPAGYIDPAYAASDPRGAQAALTRAQWNVYETEGRPLKDKISTRLLADYEPEVNAAGQQIEASYGRYDGMRDRMLGRYGMTPNSDTSNALTRRKGLMRALDIARTENTMRGSMEDRRIAGLTDLFQTTKGISSSAAGDLSTAASLANQRAMAGKQNAAKMDRSDDALLYAAAGAAAMYFL